MAQSASFLVIPAQAGIQSRKRAAIRLWVPACAGMTVKQ